MKRFKSSDTLTFKHITYSRGKKGSYVIKEEKYQLLYLAILDSLRGDLKKSEKYNYHSLKKYVKKRCERLKRAWEYLDISVIVAAI